MSTQSEKLISLLKELFQTDQAELDFGIYKVINQRRDEINRFLEERLLPQIKEAFSTYQSVDTKILQDELKQAMRQAEDLGVDPETSSKVKGIREQIATYSVDVEDLENQVFSDLYNFFRRYYDEGDFISQRRYKEGVYAIPYEGEEVKLYWANHDQYYIKTSEYFRDYSFKLPSGKRAHFKLVEADTEKDNRKEIDDSKRRFVLAEALPELK
jgi:adenine-specific DNA-methyltransferase